VPEKSCETTIPDVEFNTIENNVAEQPVPLSDPAERLERLKRCFACLAHRAAREEQPPPITPANLSLCTGLQIKTNRLRTLAKQGLLTEVDPQSSHPFSPSRYPESTFILKDREAVPYSDDQPCDLDTARYTNILSTRMPAALAILEAITLTAADTKRFRRNDIRHAARVSELRMSHFITKFRDTSYIQLDPESKEYIITPKGEPFFAFARKRVRVRSDNKAHFGISLNGIIRTETRSSLMGSEQELFDALSDIAPPYTAGGIASNYPFSRSVVRRVLEKLADQGYMEKKYGKSNRVSYRPTARGYALLDTDENDVLLHEADARQKLLRQLVKQTFLLDSQDADCPYTLGPLAARFSTIEVWSYLHTAGVSTLVAGKHPTAIELSSIAKRHNSSIDEFAAKVSSGLSALSAEETLAKTAQDQRISQLGDRVAQCVVCIKSRGAHTEGGIVKTGDLMKCISNASKRDVGIALRRLSDQKDAPLVRDPRSVRHARYILTNVIPEALENTPDTCYGITPILKQPTGRSKDNGRPAQPRLKEPIEQYPILQQAKEHLERLGITDDSALHGLQLGINERLLVIKKVAAGDAPQAILRNPTYDRQTKSYVTYNTTLAALSPVMRRVVAHHLGVGMILHGRTEDPRVLKHAVGLASTDSLDDYVKNVIATLL